MRAALSVGALSADALSRYRAAQSRPLTRLLLLVPAFRTRFLADSAFVFKLLVQEVVGNGTALAGEIAVRGSDIVHELEYVASDLVVGTVVEAAFVWLLAPTLAAAVAARGGGGGGGGGGVGGGVREYLAQLPSHVFQSSAAGGRAFTPMQRAVAFVYAGVQYAGIGFVAGLVGTALTYAMIEGRKRVDKSYVPERPLPDVVPNSLAWAAFMGLSSNTRFQVVEGLELGIAKAFGGVGGAGRRVAAAIVALRFANNYWGGVQFVQFLRYLGLHATSEEEKEDSGKAVEN